MKFTIVLAALVATCLANPLLPNIGDDDHHTHHHRTTTTARRTTTAAHPTTTAAHPTTTAAHPTTTAAHPTTTAAHPTTSHAPSSKCGSPAIQPDIDSKIVGGKDAIPYSWPWQAALFTKPAFGAAYQFCGGSLISSQWVMTAGHCFYQNDQNPGKFQVKLGVFNKGKDDEPGELVLNISEIHINPKYNPSQVTFDITLLKLTEPVKFTDHISPVCLPAKQDQPLPDAGTATFVTGWGTTSSGGQDSPTLKQVSVPIVSTDKCEAAYPGQIYPDTQFCAGLDQGGKDSCQGDSGGPVVYQDPDTKTWTELGIVSWGRGCALPKYYGVYSKVSAYVDFIHQYVKDL